jgi:ABC-2 type transport system permease protein
MHAFWTLTRRELSGFFLSLAGYVIISAAVFLIGFSFLIMMANLRQEPTMVPMTEVWYVTPFFWLILLLSSPAITMRLFALEKFSGTFETLMTTPVTDAQVVLAKFVAAFIFYVTMWLPLLGCLFVIRHYTNDTSSWDPGALCSTFLGILLFGAVFMAVGCCASALTRSQVIAAMISLAFGASLFLLGYVATQFANSPGWAGQVLASFNLFDQMHDFARGIVDTRPIILCVSLTLFFLFLTLRVIESRRWK